MLKLVKILAQDNKPDTDEQHMDKMLGASSASNVRWHHRNSPAHQNLLIERLWRTTLSHTPVLWHALCQYFGSAFEYQGAPLALHQQLRGS